MSNQPLIVRFVQAAEKPAAPKVNYEITIDSEDKKHLFAKAGKIFTGSSLGFIAGLLIFLTLKTTGVDLGNIESSFVIGMPAILGIISSFAIC